MVGRNPRRRDLPDTLADLDDDLLLDLYCEFRWSCGDIADCLEESDAKVRDRLQELGVDTADRNRGPVTGPARELWTMDPDEYERGGA